MRQGIVRLHRLAWMYRILRMTRPQVGLLAGSSVTHCNITPANAGGNSFKDANTMKTGSTGHPSATKEQCQPLASETKDGKDPESFARGCGPPPFFRKGGRPPWMANMDSENTSETTESSSSPTSPTEKMEGGPQEWSPSGYTENEIPPWHAYMAYWMKSGAQRPPWWGKQQGHSSTGEAKCEADDRDCSNAPPWMASGPSQHPPRWGDWGNCQTKNEQSDEKLSAADGAYMPYWMKNGAQHPPWWGTRQGHSCTGEAKSEADDGDCSNVPPWMASGPSQHPPWWGTRQGHSCTGEAKCEADDRDCSNVPPWMASGPSQHPPRWGDWKEYQAKHRQSDEQLNAADGTKKMTDDRKFYEGNQADDGPAQRRGPWAAPGQAPPFRFLFGGGPPRARVQEKEKDPPLEGEPFSVEGFIAMKRWAEGNDQSSSRGFPWFGHPAMFGSRNRSPGNESYDSETTCFGPPAMFSGAKGPWSDYSGCGKEKEFNSSSRDTNTEKIQSTENTESEKRQSFGPRWMFSPFGKNSTWQ